MSQYISENCTPLPQMQPKDWLIHKKRHNTVNVWNFAFQPSFFGWLSLYEINPDILLPEPQSIRERNGPTRPDLQSLDFQILRSDQLHCIDLIPSVKLVHFCANGMNNRIKIYFSTTVLFSLVQGSLLGKLVYTKQCLSYPNGSTDFR